MSSLADFLSQTPQIIQVYSSEVKSLCDKTKEILMQESNVQSAGTVVLTYGRHLRIYLINSAHCIGTSDCGTCLTANQGAQLQCGTSSSTSGVFILRLKIMRDW
ncbi:uncharacterized protein [Rutidosis leptorrhynchoides]|uniref:uncharacterized protein n=1 Tax=Rutidosis leptorrhynchoides TaxID=125765 RepID=UPI003A9949E8